MERSQKYYVKKGRRYVEKQSYDLMGFGEGLWLITKKPYSTQTQNILYAVKTHDIQNVGRFSDFYNAHRCEINEKLRKNYDAFMEKLGTENKGFSVSDLTDVVIKTLSEI